MGDLTVVYYTSNREDEAFEAKIRASLLSVIGDLPLVSVSQKPIDFGKNICVGDVGVSNFNAHRQFQIGAIAAQTPFVAAAEADCLYPPEYFQFRPPVLNKAYRCAMWLLWTYQGYFYKPFSEATTIVGRDYVIAAVDAERAGNPTWQPTMDNIGFTQTFRQAQCGNFDGGPIVSFKSSRGMHQKHGTIGRPVEKIQRWGNCNKLREEYELS